MIVAAECGGEWLAASYQPCCGPGPADPDSRRSRERHLPSRRLTCPMKGFGRASTPAQTVSAETEISESETSASPPRSSFAKGAVTCWAWTAGEASRDGTGQRQCAPQSGSKGKGHGRPASGNGSGTSPRTRPRCPSWLAGRCPLTVFPDQVHAVTLAAEGSPLTVAEAAAVSGQSPSLRSLLIFRENRRGYTANISNTNRRRLEIIDENLFAIFDL